MRDALYLIVFGVFHCFENRFGVLLFKEGAPVVHLGRLNSLEKGVPCYDVCCLSSMAFQSNFSLFGRHFLA